MMSERALFLESVLQITVKPAELKTIRVLERMEFFKKVKSLEDIILFSLSAADKKKKKTLEGLLRLFSCFYCFTVVFILNVENKIDNNTQVDLAVRM